MYLHFEFMIVIFSVIVKIYKNYQQIKKCMYTFIEKRLFLLNSESALRFKIIENMNLDLTQLYISL